MIQYPGGTIVNTTFTGATKNNIVTNLETQLTNAGWSVVSGSGSGDVVMRSAATPTAGNSIDVRLRDSAATNCAVINMQNATGLLVSQNFFLLPAAAKTFRVIAHKYGFQCFTPGASAAREFVMCHTLWIPSDLHGVITGDLGFIQGNATSDTDTSLRLSLRTAFHVITNNFWNSGLVNGNLMNSGATSDPTIGAMRVVATFSAYTSGSASQYGYRWHDDSLNTSDPLMAWGLTSHLTDEARIRGQIWGAMVQSDAFAGDTVIASYDGHSWHGLTNSNNGGAAGARGTLFLQTS